MLKRYRRLSEKKLELFIVTYNAFEEKKDETLLKQTFCSVTFLRSQTVLESSKIGEGPWNNDKCK